MRQVEIPDKLYFKIGEVAKLAGVEPYVLRYWETEFKEICPTKSRANQRLYRRRDVDIVLSIKRLLHEQGFTIQGARKKIRENGRGAKGEISERAAQMALALDAGVPKDFLRKLKSGLEELLKLLQSS